MKKQRKLNRKRLQLSKSTIRNLQRDRLRRVAGGGGEPEADGGEDDGTILTCFPLCPPDTNINLM